MEKETIPCVHCQRDLRAVIAKACRKQVVVYRMDTDAVADAPRAEAVFVECPCGTLYEYPCPGEETP